MPSRRHRCKRAPNLDKHGQKRSRAAQFACRQDAAGLFRDKASCKSSCSAEQVEAADSVIAAVNEWTTVLGSDPSQSATWSFQLAPHLSPKTWNVVKEKTGVFRFTLVGPIPAYNATVTPNPRVEFTLFLTDGYPHVILHWFFPPSLSRP